MKKYNFFSVLLIFVQLCILSSCKDKDDDMMIGDEFMGYFSTPNSPVEYYSVSEDEGVVDLELYGYEDEDVIPIIWICDNPDYIKGDTELRDDRKDKVFYPSAVFEADGYAEYPNTLDYKYQYKWVKASTHKEKGTRFGTLHIEYDANDTYYDRYMCIYLHHQDEGLLIIKQSPKKYDEKK